MNNNDEKAYITVGKVGSTYGVHGWIRINAYTEYTANILSYKPWFLSDPETGEVKEITLEDGRLYNQQVIVKFQGIDTPETARLLTGKAIVISRSQLPDLKPHEYYWADLKGLTVINEHGQILGKVIYLMATGSNDVLVVKGDKEHAIPYLLGTVIQHIDLEKREIHVHWEII